jgi:poly(A) polymerase
MPIRDKIRPAAANVVRRLVDNGYEAFLVGGAVRDLLLGQTPKDYDIATSASPEEVQALFGRRSCRIIGRRFRLAHVFSGGDIYEVSTFRREPSASERRGRFDDDGVMIWNDNRYGSLEEDARRRDFTVNSLYYDIAGKRGIIDLVGGVKDMRQRIVRTVGDPALRMEEDPVRLLRGLKLVGQQGFSLVPALDKALRRHAASIRQASVSRLFEELLKIFFTGHSLEIITAFADYGLLEHFWPTMAHVWEGAEGPATRSALGERDAALRNGDYSNSKALALATACLPWVVSQLRDSEDARGLWQPGGEQAAACSAAILAFYEGFVLPRFFSARMREMFLMLPSLADPARARRCFRHREYKYGRALLILLQHAQNCDCHDAEALPLPEEAELADAPPRKRRRRPRRRSPQRSSDEDSGGSKPRAARRNVDDADKN